MANTITITRNGETVEMTLDEFKAYSQGISAEPKKNKITMDEARPEAARVAYQLLGDERDDADHETALAKLLEAHSSGILEALGEAKASFYCEYFTEEINNLPEDERQKKEKARSGQTKRFRAEFKKFQPRKVSTDGESGWSKVRARMENLVEFSENLIEIISATDPEAATELRRQLKKI